MRRTGIRSIYSSRFANRPAIGLTGAVPSRTTFPPALLQGKREGIRQFCFRDHIFKIDPQMHNGLSYLRPHPADNAFGPHQARRRNRLQQVLRHQRIDSGNTGDVDNCVF